MKGKKRLAAGLLAVLLAFYAVPTAFAAGGPMPQHLPAGAASLGGLLAVLSIPATGDRTNYGLYIGIACAAAVVLVIVVLLGMRKPKK